MLLDFFRIDLQDCKHESFLEITSFGGSKVIFLIS
jgi:hypothetical protein